VKCVALERRGAEQVVVHQIFAQLRRRLALAAGQREMGLIFLPFGRQAGPPRWRISILLCRWNRALLVEAYHRLRSLEPCRKGADAGKADVKLGAAKSGQAASIIMELRRPSTSPMKRR